MFLFLFHCSLIAIHQVEAIKEAIKHLKMYNIVHFLKRMLQVVDNVVFWQNVLLYFENDPLSPIHSALSLSF